MLCGGVVFSSTLSVNAYLPIPFCSGRALTPQETLERFRFLSFIDNVPFDDTLRAKGYSTFITAIIPQARTKSKRLKALARIFF